MKIVIVDDDKAIRALLRALCESAGHTVTAEFDSGANLVAHVCSQQPDVVLLDYQLPGANGLELLVALDTDANHADVVMITASEDPDLEGHAADKGATGFIHKPINEAQFHAELQSIEETRRIAAKGSVPHAPTATPGGSVSPGKPHPNAAVIIDDSGSVRFLLKGILEGIKVHVAGLAANAKEGLHLVAKVRPAMIFLDVEMPGMNGIEAMPHLRQASPGSAIVIITGNASRTIVEAAAAAGAKGYFLKPVRPAKVEEFVTRLLSPPAASTADTPAPAVQTFEWTPAWSVGVPGLDRDHQHLVAIINRLSGSMAGNGEAASDKSSTLLGELAEYGQRHFKSEEAYMRHIGYPGLGEHILEHRDFLEKMGAFTIAASCGVLDPAELYRYLSTWLREHVFGSDMRFRQAS